MGLLGILAGGITDRLGRHVFLAVLGGDQVAHRLHRLFRDAEAVGSHVGDEPDRPGTVDIDAFVEFLSHFHGALASEPHPDRGLLLERARLEWRIGLVELLGLIDPRDDVIRRGQFVADLASVDLGTGGELVTVVFGQRCLEPVGLRLGPGRADRRGDFPELLRDEGANLAFAVDDQPHGHRLDPARAQVPRHLAPEQRAELIADEAIEEPACLLGVDHVHVHRPDLAECILHGAFGDFVESDASHPIIAEFESLLQVPGDGLALAVGVGRQIDDVGPGRLALQVAHGVFLGRYDFIGGRITVLHIQSELPLGKVANMAHACLDDVLGAEELVDRLGLLGALDDHQGAVSHCREEAPRRHPLWDVSFCSSEHDGVFVARFREAGFAELPFSPVVDAGDFAGDFLATLFSHLSSSDCGISVDPYRPT